MNTILDAQDTAVKQLERIFEQSGWLDGLFSNNTKKPVFYKNTIPNTAWSRQLKMSQGATPRQANLFLLYKLAPSEFINADNRVYGVVSAFNITIYYDNMDICTNEPSNLFMIFLKNLINNLENNDWHIQDFGETAFEATDSQGTWQYSRGYKITKVFTRSNI